MAQNELFVANSEIDNAATEQTVHIHNELTLSVFPCFSLQLDLSTSEFMRNEQEELDKHTNARRDGERAAQQREAGENKSNRTIVKTDRPEKKRISFTRTHCIHLQPASHKRTFVVNCLALMPVRTCMLSVLCAVMRSMKKEEQDMLSLTVSPFLSTFLSTPKDIQ